MLTVLCRFLAVGLSTALHLMPISARNAATTCGRSACIANCAADPAMKRQAEGAPVPPSAEHTDGHMWDATAGNGVFQDFERECFGNEDGCDYWFYGGPSPFGPGELEQTPEHIAHINQIRAEGRAAVAARERKERHQQEALQRIKTAVRQ